MFQPPFVNIIDPTATRLRAVDNGFIYLGKKDTDPTIPANQIPVSYIDESGIVQQLSQPIKLNAAGVPVLSKSSGTIINPVFNAAVVSIVIQYKSGKNCYSNENYQTLNVPSKSLSSVDEMAGLFGLIIGEEVVVTSYYGDNLSQPLRFVIVAEGTGTHDGGKYIDCIGCQAMQLFPYDTPSLKMYGGKDEGKLGFDNATALQNALNYKSAVILDNSVTGYMVGKSIDLTNRVGGATLICIGHVGINNIGTYIWGNTGERAVFDLVGSERNNFSGWGLGTATGNNNPSKLGVFCARSSTSEYAQFNMFSNFVINIDIDDAAFDGMGTFGMYNIASEITSYHNISFIANTPCYIGRSNIASVATYAGDLSSITSCSDFEFSGTCNLNSNGSVGTPLHTEGAQSIRGYIYTNGRPKSAAAGQDPNASCWRSEGVTTNCDLTIFIEFSHYVMTLGGSFNDNEITFLGQVNENRYILKNTDSFIGLNNSNIIYQRTVSGSFVKPNYFIILDAGDTAKNLDINIPYTPNTSVISNNSPNQVQCSFTLEGKKIHSFESTTSYEVYAKARENGAVALWGYIVGSSPEGLKIANPGSMFSANIAGVGKVFKKESGTGNTGWVEL